MLKQQVPCQTLGLSTPKKEMLKTSCPQSAPKSEVKIQTVWTQKITGRGESLGRFARAAGDAGVPWRTGPSRQQAGPGPAVAGRGLWDFLSHRGCASNCYCFVFFFGVSILHVFLRVSCCFGCLVFLVFCSLVVAFCFIAPSSLFFSPLLLFQFAFALAAGHCFSRSGGLAHGSWSLWHFAYGARPCGTLRVFSFAAPGFISLVFNCSAAVSLQVLVFFLNLALCLTPRGWKVD